MTVPPMRWRGRGPSLAATTDRLLVEFGARLDEHTVGRVVSGCRHDLTGCPPGALPELVERLARQRLLDGDTTRPAPPRRGTRREGG